VYTTKITNVNNKLYIGAKRFVELLNRGYRNEAVSAIGIIPRLNKCIISGDDQRDLSVGSNSDFS